MSATFIQGVSGTSNPGGTSASLAFTTQNTTAGSLLVALILVFAGSIALNSVTDDQGGNVWTILPKLSVPAGVTFGVYLAYALNTTGGTKATITAHAASSTSDILMAIGEYGGVNTFRAHDAGNTGSSVTAYSSASVAASAGDLLIGYMGLGGAQSYSAIVATAGVPTKAESASNAVGNSVFGLIQHNLNASAGSPTSGGSMSSNNFAAGLAAFFFQNLNPLSTTLAPTPIPVTVANSSGYSLPVTSPTLGSKMGQPTPIVFCDANGNELAVTGSTKGAFIASPTPVVLCDATGHPLVAPFVYTSNGNSVTVSATLTGVKLGQPIPVVLTDPNGFLYTLSGFSVGPMTGAPTPICITDGNGNVISLSGIAT